MESASSVPKKVILEGLADCIEDELYEMSTSANTDQEKSDNDIKTKENIVKKQDDKVAASKVREQDPDSFKDFKEMLKTFEEYENKYIAEFTNLEEKHASLMKEKANLELEDKFGKSLEDIFEALKGFKRQSHLFKSRLNKSGCSKEKDIDDKDKLEFLGEKMNIRPRDASKIAKAVKAACEAKIAKGQILVYNALEKDSKFEAETSFINDPSKKFYEDSSDDDEASDFLDKSSDNSSDIYDEDDESDQGIIAVQNEDGKWDDAASVEIVVHNPQTLTAMAQTNVAIRRPDLFSTFDLVKHLLKTVLCFTDDEYENQRTCGLTIQEWMILATSFIIFVACCIVIAFIGMRYKDCSRVALAQAGTIDHLLSDKEALKGFLRGIKYHNSTLYNVVKNEVMKFWDK